MIQAWRDLCFRIDGTANLPLHGGSDAWLRMNWPSGQLSSCLFHPKAHLLFFECNNWHCVGYFAEQEEKDSTLNNLEHHLILSDFFPDFWKKSGTHPTLLSLKWENLQCHSSWRIQQENKAPMLFHSSDLWYLQIPQYTHTQTQKEWNSDSAGEAWNLGWFLVSEKSHRHNWNSYWEMPIHNFSDGNCQLCLQKQLGLQV